MKRSALVLGLVLAGCVTGRAEWMRRGTDSGELRLKGPLDAARADATGRIAEVCGAANFTSQESATRVDRNHIATIVHFDCAKE